MNNVIISGIKISFDFFLTIDVHFLEPKFHFKIVLLQNYALITRFGHLNHIFVFNLNIYLLNDIIDRYV